MNFIKEIGISKKKWDIHAVLLPEEKINLTQEIVKIKKIMEENDCVNIFLSEGAGLDIIIKETEKTWKKILRRCFWTCSFR